MRRYVFDYAHGVSAFYYSYESIATKTPTIILCVLFCVLCVCIGRESIVDVCKPIVVDIVDILDIFVIFLDIISNTPP